MIVLFDACSRTCSYACIMEHPALPRDSSLPSAWKLPELQFVEQHPLGDAVTVNQCAFKAPDMKNYHHTVL